MKHKNELESVALGFKRYVTQCFPPMEKEQFDDLERTFYAGALWVLSQVNQASAELPEAAAGLYISNLANELFEFCPGDGGEIGPKIPPEGGNQRTN